MNARALLGHCKRILLHLRQELAEFRGAYAIFRRH